MLSLEAFIEISEAERFAPYARRMTRSNNYNGIVHHPGIEPEIIQYTKLISVIQTN